MPKIEIEEDELRRLLDERDHLRNQVAELQAQTTAVLERRREYDLTWQVGTFHRALGYPTRHIPQLPARDELVLRLRLITEEFFEVLEAGHIAQGGVSKQDELDGIRDAMLMSFGHSDYALDLPEFADALGDLDYVVEGTRLTCGIPRQSVANEIQRSNMAKQGGRDENNKTIKPPGWTPPDIRGVLLEHGWKNRNFEELLEASSLGTSEVKAIAAQTDEPFRGR